MEWLDIMKAIGSGIVLLGGGVVIGRYFGKAPGGAEAFKKRKEEAMKKPLPKLPPPPTRVHRFTDDDEL